MFNKKEITELLKAYEKWKADKPGEMNIFYYDQLINYLVIELSGKNTDEY